MSESGIIFVALCAIALVMIGILYKLDLLTLPVTAGETRQSGSDLALMSPLIGFLIFLATCAFVPHWAKKLIHYMDTHGFSSFSQQESDNVSQLVALVVAAFLLMGFNRIHPDTIRTRIWGQKPPLKAISKGILFCILTYPIVMALVQGIHLAMQWLGRAPIHEQVALSQLKHIRSYPWLFWSFACSIITLVPLVEEFLFRGLFQNYMMKWGGAKLAIFLTSVLFALFHYASEQGSTNIELMIGLFFYSFFIGIFYLRERSLWTSIAMHATFNAITLLFMIFVLPQ